MFKIVAAAFFCLLMMGNSKLNAQRSFVSIDLINTNPIPITDVMVNDIIGDDSKITYTASFTISMRQDDDTKKILAYLKSSGGSQFSSITLIRANIDNRPVENREYRDATITLLNLAELDATSKAILQLHVELKAEAMFVRKGDGVVIKLPTTRIKPVMASSFQFELGTLPTRRVSKISGLSLSSNNQFVDRGGSQPVDFTIELSGVDAKEWHTWLQKIGSGAAIKEQGRLILLAPDFKEVLYEINLQDVIITSYSYAINNDAGQNPDPQATIKNVTIGLRANSVLINTIK